MDPLKEIERMRTTLSDIAKEHPDLETIVQDANDDLWALGIALEVKEEGDGNDEG